MQRGEKLIENTNNDSCMLFVRIF